MPLLGRRGFTLIELLIALVLLAMVTASLYGVLVSNQRVSHAQSQGIDLQQNLRVAVTLLPSELRVLNANDGDIIAMSADSIRFRAMRVFGVTCSAPVLGGALTGRTMIMRDALTYGSRTFAVGDSALVYYEGDRNTRSDDSWVPARVTAVAAQPCPGDNRPGTQLTADLAAFVAPQVNQAGKIAAGGPFWRYEVLTYKVYQAADGNWYVGQRNANGIEPLIGPLTGAGGLTFLYYDAAGAATAVRTNVATIEIRVRERTAQTIYAQGGRINRVDSVATRVALRNNRRF